LLRTTDKPPARGPITPGHISNHPSQAARNLLVGVTGHTASRSSHFMEEVMLRLARKSFGVVARLQGLPEKAEELRRRLHILTDLTRTEDGCISCEIAENGSDSTEFTILAEWSNEEAHQAHFGKITIKHALQFLPNLLSVKLDLHTYVLPLNTIRYGTNSYCLSIG
jgi:quinol monooxygenase YgiN